MKDEVRCLTNKHRLYEFPSSHASHASRHELGRTGGETFWKNWSIGFHSRLRKGFTFKIFNKLRSLVIRGVVHDHVIVGGIFRACIQAPRNE